MTAGQKVGTIVFRVIVGMVGLTILVVGIKYRLYAQDLRAFSALGAFCGLTLGYAIAGDKLAARLVYLFSGHRVPVEEEADTPISSHPDASDSSLPSRNV